MDRTRRAVLAGVVGTGAALAGCAGSEPSEPPENVPDSIHTFHVERVETNGYERAIVDRTGQDTVSVTVGAEGGGSAMAFAPAAMRISAGTTVSWEWTGSGGPHNVVSVADSDFEFNSGRAVVEREPFTETFEETGIALYHCVPHASSGMRGAFEVV